MKQVLELEVPKYGAEWLDVAEDGKSFWLALDKGDVLHYVLPSSTPRTLTVGTWLVSAGTLSEGQIFAADRSHLEIWDSALTGQTAKWSLPAHDPPLSVKHVAISDDLRYLGIDDAVYDIEQGRWLFERVGHGAQSALVFRGDKVLTAGFHDRRVVVRTLPRGSEKVLLMKEPVTAAVFAQGTSQVAVATSERVGLWNIDEPALVREYGCAGASQLRLCASEKSLVALCDRTVHVLEVRSLEKRSTFELDETGSALECDDTLLAVGDRGGHVYAWDLATEKLLGREQMRAPIVALAASKRAQRILATATSEQGGQSKLLEVR